MSFQQRQLMPFVVVSSQEQKAIAFADNNTRAVTAGPEKSTIKYC